MLINNSYQDSYIKFKSYCKEKYDIYQKILNIDNLNNEEKLELFNKLKQMNMMGTFYDDISTSKRIIGQEMKEKSITAESIKKYKNEDLSSKYGIDVYTGESDFYGIVKTITRRVKSDMPEGHSFTLAGNNNPYVYGAGDITFLYDASLFNPNQLVHVFPRDSYTLYRPFSFTDKPSTRVYTLMNPSELINNTSGYNEVLILEKGNTETELDKEIPNIKPIALYCIDEIKESDIENARKNNLPIFLAYTKNIKQDRYVERENIDYWNYDYYNERNSNDLEARRR